MPLLPPPGTIVSIRHARWRVARVVIAPGVARVDAVALGPRDAGATVTFLAPFDRIERDHTRSRLRRVRRQRWRAACDGLRARAEHVTLPLAAIDAAVTLLPHQLEPLLALRDGYRRILIADAVGLGKTIQAGLAIAELLRRGEAARVLIITPGHLREQWRDELRARCGVDARLADAPALAALAPALPRHVSPWSLDGVWIASIDFIKQDHILDALPTRPWDLVVIDEAHLMTGASDRREAAHRLASVGRRALLLTATPFSGLDDGAAILRLGALDDTEPLIAFRRSREEIGRPSHRRTRTLRLVPSAEEQQVFVLLTAFERAAWRAADASAADATRLFLAVLRKRALSSAQALARTVSRRLVWLDAPSAPPDAVQPQFDFGDGEGDVALTMTLGLPRERERAWLRRLGAAADAAMRTSRKLARLTALITRTREPLILFTEFRDTLEWVADALVRRHVAAAFVHGGLDPADLRRALEAFTAGRVRVLVATDVAAQGLNLQQRARWVVHVDVPWNPVRLEQRAGRVDRLGQRRAVHVTRLVLDVDADLDMHALVDTRTDHAAATPLDVTTAWRRRARAAVRVLERRRALASRWRGPLPLGRPLAAPTVPGAVWTHDFGDRETCVQCGDALSAAAVAARRRRVARIVRQRARRLLAIERALATRPRHRPASDPALPGFRTREADAQARQTHAHDIDAATDHDARTTALEQQAQAIAVRTTLRLTEG